MSLSCTSLPCLLLEPGPQRSDRTKRRSSGETILLVVPEGEGAGGKRGGGSRPHPSRSAGSPSSLGWLVRCPLRQGGRGRRGRKKKLPKLRASSSRGSCWSSSTTGTLLGVGSSHRHPCVSVWATSPRALRHVGECLPHVAFGFKDAATDSELTLMPVLRQQHVALAIEAEHPLSSPSSASTVLCGTKIDHGVLAVGHGTGVPSSMCGARPWRPCRWSRATKILTFVSCTSNSWTKVRLPKIHKTPTENDFESSKSPAKSGSWNKPSRQC